MEDKMNKMKNKTQWICINGMGIALFVALSMCLRVPVFQNYYLCLGYIIMTVYCYSFGIIDGTLVGALGTILYCVLIGGINGLPGWTLGNILIGIVLGSIFKITKKIKNGFLEILLLTIVTILVTAIGILGIKSIVDSLLFAEPFLFRVTRNMSAFIADAFMIVASLPICKLIDKKNKKG